MKQPTLLSDDSPPSGCPERRRWRRRGRRKVEGTLSTSKTFSRPTCCATVQHATESSAPSFQRLSDPEAPVLVLRFSHYIVAGSIGSSRSALTPFHIVFDTGAGINVIRRSALPNGWEACRVTNEELPNEGDANGQPLRVGGAVKLRQSFAILTRTSNGWMYVNVFIVVYVQEMDAQSHIRSCIGCARQKFQNFAIFGAKHPLAPMAFKHFTPNFERARTFTFVHVHILDVRGRAPPVTPTFGCARRNGKRPTYTCAWEMRCTPRHSSSSNTWRLT